MGIVSRHKSVGDVAVLERLNSCGNSNSQNDKLTATGNCDNIISTRTNGPATTIATTINNTSYSFGFGLNRLFKSGVGRGGGACHDESDTSSDDGRQVSTAAGVFRKRTKSSSSSSSCDSSSSSTPSSCSSEDDVDKAEINKLLNKRVGNDLNYFGRLDLLKNRRQYKSLAATDNSNNSSKTDGSTVLRNSERDRAAAVKKATKKDDLTCNVGLHKSMGNFAVVDVNDDICIHNYTGGGTKQDLLPDGYYYCDYCQHHETNDSKHRQTIQSALSFPTLIEQQVCKEHLSSNKEKQQRRRTRRLVSSTATKRQVRLRNITASDSGGGGGSASRKALQRARRRMLPTAVKVSSDITTGEATTAAATAVAHKLEGHIDGDLDAGSSAAVLQYSNGPKGQVSVVSGASQHPLGELAQVRGGGAAAAAAAPVLENSQDCCIVSVAALRRGDNCLAVAAAEASDNKSPVRNDGFYDDDYEDHKTLLAAAAATTTTTTNATATGCDSHCCTCSYCNDDGSGSDHWLDCAAEASREGGSIKLDGARERSNDDDDIGHRNANTNEDNDDDNKTVFSVLLEKSSHRNGEQVAVRNELASGAGEQEDRRHGSGQVDECEGETTAALFGCHIIESAASRRQQREGQQSAAGSRSKASKGTKSRSAKEERDGEEEPRADSLDNQPPGGNSSQRPNAPSGSASGARESVGDERAKFNNGNCVATKSRSMPSKVAVTVQHNSKGNEKQSNANLSDANQQRMPTTATVMVDIHKCVSPAAANRSHLEQDNGTCNSNTCNATGGTGGNSLTSWRWHAKSFVPTTSSHGSYDVVQHERQYSGPVARTEVDSGSNGDCITKTAATAAQQWRQISTPPEVFKSKGMTAVVGAATMQQVADTGASRIISMPSDNIKSNVNKNRQQWRLTRPGRSPISLARQTSARLARHRLNIQQQRQDQLTALARRERLNLIGALSLGSLTAGNRTIASTNSSQTERSPQRQQATPTSSSSQRQQQSSLARSDFIDVIDITSISDETTRNRRRSGERNNNNNNNNNNNLRFYASAAATTATSASGPSRPRTRNQWHRLSYSTEEAPRRRYGIYLPSQNSTASSPAGTIWRQFVKAATFGYLGSAEQTQASIGPQVSRRATIDTVAEVCIDLQPQQVRPDVSMHGQPVVSTSCSNSSGSSSSGSSCSSSSNSNNNSNMYRSVENASVPNSGNPNNNNNQNRPRDNNDVSKKQQSPSRQQDKSPDNNDRRERQPKASPSPAESTWSLEGKPFCKICHMGSSKLGDRLISPCKCSGTMRYIHCGCLLKWLELSNRNTDKPMSCELCSHEYTWHKRFNFKQLQLPKCSIKDMFLHSIFILSICSMLYFALAPMLSSSGSGSSNGSSSSSSSKLVLANSDIRHQIPTAAHLDDDSDSEHNRRFEGDTSDDSIEKFVEQLIGKNKRRASQQQQQQQQQKQQQINSNSLENTAPQTTNKQHQQTALFTNQGSYHQNSNGRLASDEKFILISAAAFFISFFVGIYVQTKTRDTLYGLCLRFIQMNRTYYITEYDHEQHQQQQQLNASSGNSDNNFNNSPSVCESVAPPDVGGGYANLVGANVVPVEQQSAPRDTNYGHNNQAITWNDNDVNNSSTRSVSGRLDQMNAASSSAKHCLR